MATNFYDTDDTPAIDDSALTLWQQQMESLANVGEEANAALKDIEKKLGATLQFADQTGNTDLADRAKALWKQAQGQHRRVQQLTAAASGAGAAIKMLQAQRDSIAHEHGTLVDAINMGDESHPLLHDYAQDIRNDLDDDGDEDYYGEMVYEGLAENLLETFGVNRTVAQKFLWLLNGSANATDTQRDLMLGFFKAFAATVNTKAAAK